MAKTAAKTKTATKTPKTAAKKAAKTSGTPRMPKAISVAIEAAQDRKATGVVVLDLKKAGAFTDYFVICSGANPRQVYPFVRLSRIAPPAPPKHSFATNPDSFSFVGSAWYTPDSKFQKTPFKDYADEKPPAAESAGARPARRQS